jgi:hypothetical protein
MSFWNPFTWVQYADSIAGPALSTIKGWVEDVVSTAVGVVEQDLDYGVGLVAQAVDNVEKALTSSIDFVANSAVTLYHDALSAVDTAADFAARSTQTVYDEITHDLDVAIDAAEGETVSLYHDAESDIATAVGTVTREAETLASAALSTAERYADDTLNGFIADIFDPVKSDVLQALSWASQMWKWFDTGVVDAWKVILQAWDWIEWFAKWSFDSIDNLEGELVDDADSSVAGFLGAMVNGDWSANLESALLAFGW